MEGPASCFDLVWSILGGFVVWCETNWVWLFGGLFAVVLRAWVGGSSLWVFLKYRMALCAAEVSARISAPV